MNCPKCNKNLEPKKSWDYWMFRVDAYFCDCGTRFREYTTINIIESPTSEDNPMLEKRVFVLVLKNGKWVKEEQDF